MISSTKNPKIRWIRGLQSKARTRHEEGAFVIEGVRLVEEALNSGWIVRQVFYSESLSERGKDLVEADEFRGIKKEFVSMHVMQAISETKTPQGLLAVMDVKTLSIPVEADFFLVIDQLRDPGNLGTILRSAVSAGVGAVYLSPGTVDPFSPKVLRAGMGAHFHLPVYESSWNDIASSIHHYSLNAYLASTDRGNVYYSVDFSIPTAIIIGGEAEGVSEAAQDISESYIHIPMPGGGDSLNASVAAGIILFEIARQRGIGS